MVAEWWGEEREGMEGRECNFQGVRGGERKREEEEEVVDVEGMSGGGEGEMSAIVGT